MINTSLKILYILIIFIFSCESKTINDPKDWKVGTYTGVLSDFTLDQFNELKVNGISCIELGSGSILNKSQEEREAWCNNIKELSEAAGIEVWSVHLPYSRSLDVSSIDPEVRIHMVDECTSIIELCSRLNPKKFIIHPSAEPIQDDEREERIENSIATLKKLNSITKAHNANLAIECLPRTCLGNTSDELLRIVNAVGDGAEICFDSNHLLQENPEDFVAKVGRLITTVHISDYDGLDEKHWLPGKGSINWPKVMSEMVKIDYNGPYMFEVVPRNNPGMSISSLKNTWDSLLEEYKNVIRL
jgi:sugar phosphate isomerase/epimerase